MSARPNAIASTCRASLRASALIAVLLKAFGGIRYIRGGGNAVALHSLATTARDEIGAGRIVGDDGHELL